jgi:hypothetical protein
MLPSAGYILANLYTKTTAEAEKHGKFFAQTSGELPMKWASAVMHVEAASVQASPQFKLDHIEKEILGRVVMDFAKSKHMQASSFAELADVQKLLQ